MGKALSTQLPNGVTISYARDRAQRLTGVTSDWVDATHPAALAANFAYNAARAVTSVEFGNGTISTRTFNSGMQLKTLQYGTPSAPGQFLDFEYDYQEGVSNTGQIMKIVDHTDAAKTVTYTYDNFFRLKTAETEGAHWGLSWTYDRYGNRLSQTVTKGSAPANALSVDASTNRAAEMASIREQIRDLLPLQGERRKVSQGCLDFLGEVYRNLAETPGAPRAALEALAAAINNSDRISFVFPPFLGPTTQGSPAALHDVYGNGSRVEILFSANITRRWWDNPEAPLELDPPDHGAYQIRMNATSFESYINAILVHEFTHAGFHILQDRSMNQEALADVAAFAALGTAGSDKGCIR